MTGVVTLKLLKIAHVFVQASSTCAFTSYGIAKQLGMDPTSGSVWATLRELESRGWLTSELIGHGTDGRSRRLYSLTNTGRESATSYLRSLQLQSTMTARSA